MRIDLDLDVLAASSRRAVMAATDVSMVRPGARPLDDAGGDRRPLGPRFARRHGRFQIVGKLYRMPVTRMHQKKDQSSVLASLCWPNYCVTGATATPT